MHVRILFALSVASSALCAAQLSVGSATTSPGETAIVEVRYTTEGAAATALQFDLEYDQSKLTVTGAVGEAATKAAKSLSVGDPSASLKRFLIAGLNQTSFDEGVVVVLSVAVKRDAPPGSYDIKLTNLSAADKSAKRVALSSGNGQVKVARLASRR